MKRSCSSTFSVVSASLSCAVALAVLVACQEESRGVTTPEHAANAPVAATATTPTPAPAPTPPPVEDLRPNKRLFAKRFVVNVRVAPNREAFRVGYLRGGAVIDATTPEPVSREGCPRGWYELTTGGFACASRDVTPFDGERLPAVRAQQPDRTAKLPYPYGSARRATPMYRRLPSDLEAAEHEGYVIPGADPSPSPSPSPEPAIAEASDFPSAEAPAAAPSTETNLVATTPAAAPTEAPADEAAQPTLGSLLGEEGSVVARRLVKGFNVSLDRDLRAGRRRYWRTQSNGYIPYDSIALVRGSDFVGTPLAADAITLPIAYVLSSRSDFYELGERDRLRRRGEPGYHHLFHVAGERELRGQLYLHDDEARYFRARDVTRIVPRPRPEEVAADEKWIDIDLDLQTLVAYEGDTPVYATLISSGKPGEELGFETPTGEFRITSKHLATTMDGDHAVDGPYSIEDVPYVMYFQLAYALHSAFWHNAFGRPRSHGCVNLSPLDARWVFDWSEPHLPQGWHGVYPSAETPGTRIYIHGEARYR